MTVKQLISALQKLSNEFDFKLDTSVIVKGYSEFSIAPDYDNGAIVIQGEKPYDNENEDDDFIRFDNNVDWETRW